MPSANTACRNAYTRIDGRNQANRRADALADLVLGPIGHGAQGSRAAKSKRGPLWRRKVKIDLRVTLPFTALAGFTENPGHLTGYGPRSAEQCRQLAADGIWRRILTDPATGNPVDFGTTRYKPSANLRDAILTTHPMCTRPSGPRCRRGHRIKQTWPVEHKPDGSAIWTTPSGHRYEYKAEPIADLVTEKPLRAIEDDDEPPF